MAAAGAGLFFLLLAPSWAGCLQGPAPVEDPNALETLWQRGLADHIATPPIAERRSTADRWVAVSPPGSPEFAAFDELIAQVMRERGVPAGVFALMRDGQVRYANGYGYLDAAGTVPTSPSSMFRLASISKPMTAAVVTMQVGEGLYDWNDPVFCLGEATGPGCLLHIPVHPARPVADRRLASITVADLLAHKSGWSQFASDELFFNGRPVEIARELGVDSPPDPWRVAQYLFGTPLDTPPGTAYAYCNACYVILGLVAEAATGAHLSAVYDAYLFRPLEVTGDIAPGRSLPEDRDPREPEYVCEFGTAPNVYRPEERVCHPDGGFDLEGLLAAGGLVATAPAVAALYEVYAPDGSVRGKAPADDRRTGGLPGTAGFVRTIQDDGSVIHEVQFAAVFNRLGGTEYPALGAPATIFDLEEPLAYLARAWATRENARMGASPRAAPWFSAS